MGLLGERVSRIRTVKPSYWSHHKVARVSRDARLLFLGLLNEADDEGRLDGSVKRIAGIVFPHDDDVTARKVARWLDELASVGLAVPYEACGHSYLVLPGFTEHQVVNRPTPSTLPAPPPDISLTGPGVLPDNAVGEGKGMERNGGRARAERIPDTFTVTEEMNTWAKSKCPDIDIVLHTQRFVNYWKAAGGRNAVKLDWLRTWQNWLLKEQDSTPTWKRTSGKAKL